MRNAIIGFLVGLSLSASVWAGSSSTGASHARKRRDRINFGSRIVELPSNSTRKSVNSRADTNRTSSNFNEGWSNAITGPVEGPPDEGLTTNRQ